MTSAAYMVAEATQFVLGSLYLNGFIFKENSSSMNNNCCCVKTFKINKYLIAEG